MNDKQTPPDWVLFEASKRSEFANLADLEWLREEYHNFTAGYRALCDMIERYEQPPPDRKLLCAREAYGSDDGTLDDCEAIETAIRAIELYEEGFGK
jgi:hypothetical protein